MDSGGRARSLCGAGRRDLQVDRLRRGDPFFRPAGAGSRKDKHGRDQHRGIRSHHCRHRRLDTQQKPGALDYIQFSLTAPAPEQTFFGDEVINAHLTLNPNLKPGQSVHWHLNGSELDGFGPTDTAITLPHLDRGTYAIAATVTDRATGKSRSSDSVTFYVRQPSELSPQHQKP